MLAMLSVRMTRIYLANSPKLSLRTCCCDWTRYENLKKEAGEGRNVGLDGGVALVDRGTGYLIIRGLVSDWDRTNARGQ
jgi:hypothetical protein